MHERRLVAGQVDRRRGYRLGRAGGLLRADADPERLALGTFAALQGGLLLTQTRRSIEPLEAALDGALAGMNSFRE